MSEVKEDERRLVVNGQATTQEAIRFSADQTLGALVRRSSAMECEMAEAILALLDLLEATQDTVEYLSTPAGRMS